MVWFRERFSRRSRATRGQRRSHCTTHVGQRHGAAGCCGLCNGHHRAHGSNAVIEASRTGDGHVVTAEDRIGEGLQLAAVEVCVGTEWAMVAGIGLAEDLDV